MKRFIKIAAKLQKNFFIQGGNFGTNGLNFDTICSLDQLNILILGDLSSISPNLELFFVTYQAQPMLFLSCYIHLFTNMNCFCPILNNRQPTFADAIHSLNEI
jgi:hypothetical protein